MRTPSPAKAYAFTDPNPNPNPNPEPGELHSCVRTVSGQAYAFGDSALGQTGSTLMADVVVTPTLVEGLGDSSVVEVAVGDHHTVVRLSTGTCRMHM